MPKSEHPIVQFDGGENSDADPRDIQDNEVAYLRGLYTDRKGMLRAGGSLPALGTVPASKAGGLLSIDVDNPAMASLLLGHNGSTVSGTPDAVELSVTTARPVLSYFDGGINLADGTLGSDVAKRMYFRRQDRSLVGDGTSATWVTIQNSATSKNPFLDSNRPHVAVSSHEGTRAISSDTAGSNIYEIDIYEVIELENLAGFGLDIFFFYTNSATLTVEELPGQGRVIVHIPWNGTSTPSAATVINAINANTTFIRAVAATDTALFTGNGPWALVEADLNIPAGSGTTSGKTDNFDNGKGTLWYYGAGTHSGFRMRNRGFEGRNPGSPAGSAPSITVSGDEFNITNAPNHFKGDILDFFPVQTGACAVHFASEKDEDAVLPTTTLQFGASYVYHGHFDTPPWIQGIGIKLYGGYGYNAEVNWYGKSLPAGVDMVRVWVRDGDRSDWLLFCEFDPGKGYRFFSQADWQPLQATSNANVFRAGPVRVNEFGSATYRTVNGYDPGDAVGATYRAAAYAAGRMFAFGIRQNGVIDSDRVLVSPPTKPGLLPEKNYIVFSTEDGDQYNVAEAVGDKIIAFKNRKAYVVNVEGNEPSTYYVEAEYDGLGIQDRNQICRTDMGVFFMNANGLYVWDGQRPPVSIIQSRIETWWRANFPALTSVSIGYSPVNRKVVAVLGTNVVVFDMTSNSFSIIAGSADFVNLSNMQWTGSALVMGRGANTGYQYLDAPANQAVAEVRTKVFTNNIPGSRKKLKRIQLTFNRALSSGEKEDIRLSYSLDGLAWTAIAHASLVQMVASSNIYSYQHVITPSKTAYAIQVRVDVIVGEGNIWPSDLQLLDISIVYKQKRPK